MSRDRLPILILVVTVACGLCALVALPCAASAEPVADPGSGEPQDEVAVDSLVPAGIDSLDPMPDWTPRDPDAGVPLTPHAMAQDPLGRLWILDRSRSRIARPGGDDRWRSFGVGNSGGSPAPVADIAASGSFLYLLEPADESVALLDLEGLFRDRVDLGVEIERAGYRGFLASRLLVGRSGDLWLIETRTGRLLAFDRSGRFVDAPLEKLAGSERPRRIADAALAPNDDVLLLDSARGGIVTVGTMGTGPHPFLPLAGGAIVEPASLACDSRGLRFIFEANGRLRVVTPDGTVVRDSRVTGAGPDGPHRSCIIDRDVLCAADAAHGTIHRWRIMHRGPEDAQH